MPRGDREPETEHDPNATPSGERLHKRDTDWDIDPARVADADEDRYTRDFFSEERGG